MNVADACELINRYRGSAVTATFVVHQVTSGQPDLVGRLQTSGRVVEARASSPHLFELTMAGVSSHHRLMLRTRNRELVWYADSERLVITERTDSRLEVVAELTFGVHSGADMQFGLTVSN
ncbi:MAG: hypothetical protein ACM3XN_04895 [Chloroflexota bacterium]